MLLTCHDNMTLSTLRCKTHEVISDDLMCVPGSFFHSGIHFFLSFFNSSDGKQWMMSKIELSVQISVHFEGSIVAKNT